MEWNVSTSHVVFVIYIYTVEMKRFLQKKLVKYENTPRRKRCLSIEQVHKSFSGEI